MSKIISFWQHAGQYVELDFGIIWLVWLGAKASGPQRIGFCPEVCRKQSGCSNFKLASKTPLIHRLVENVDSNPHEDTRLIMNLLRPKSIANHQISHRSLKGTTSGCFNCWGAPPCGTFAGHERWFLVDVLPLLVDDSHHSLVAILTSTMTWILTVVVYIH